MHVTISRASYAISERQPWGVRRAGRRINTDAHRAGRTVVVPEDCCHGTCTVSCRVVLPPLVRVSPHAAACANLSIRTPGGGRLKRRYEQVVYARGGCSMRRPPGANRVTTDTGGEVPWSTLAHAYAASAARFATRTTCRLCGAGGGQEVQIEVGIPSENLPARDFSHSLSSPRVQWC